LLLKRPRKKLKPKHSKKKGLLKKKKDSRKKLLRRRPLRMPERLH